VRAADLVRFLGESAEQNRRAALSVAEAHRAFATWSGRDVTRTAFGLAAKESGLEIVVPGGEWFILGWRLRDSALGLLAAPEVVR